MNGLWDFANELYQHQQIKSLCLELQDKFEVDVCLLLTLVWLAAQHKTVDKQSIAELLHIVDDWQQHITLPLRSLRKAIAGFPENDNCADSDLIYQQLKRVELDAERLALQRLEQAIMTRGWLQAAGSGPSQNRDKDLLCVNIQNYLQDFGLIEAAAIDTACQCFVDVW